RTFSRFRLADEPREKENRNFPQARIRRRLAREIAATFAWHIDIEQHNGRPELQRSRERARGFIHDHHFVLAGVLEDHAGEPRKIYIVIHNQHTVFAHAYIGARRMQVWLTETTYWPGSARITSSHGQGTTVEVVSPSSQTR